MNLFRNKLFAASPIIALMALFIFVLTSYPAATMKPANLPIAVVNLDEGAILQDGTEMKLGEALLGQITTGAGAADRSQGGTAASPVKWVEVGSYEEMREGLDDRQYYAALVIPADFSAKQASLRSSAPESPRLEALVNQGMNATASSMVTQMMSGALATINDAVSAQLLAELEAKGATLTPSQAAVVVSPIVSSITNVNETGSSPARGNAPVSLFQPLWMASIAGAAVSTIAAGKAVEAADSRKRRLLVRLSQLALGILVALPVGFGLSWLADAMLQLDVPDIADVGWFLSLSVLSFFLMISAVLSWTGIRGIVLFVLLLFFGTPLLALPEEFMNGFYRDWIHSWLPMRFLVDGLRELFFFGGGISWNGATVALSGIAVVSLVVLLLSIYKPSAATKKQGVGVSR